jgi:hypothetical protein
MSDRFRTAYSSPHGPYKDAFVVTPDDGTVFVQPTTAITVAVTGNVNLEMIGFGTKTVFGPAANIDFIDGGANNDQITMNSANTTYNFVTEGYGVGDSFETRDANNATNSNTFTILAISGANNETIDVATASVVADTTDTTVRLADTFGANVLFQGVTVGEHHKVRAVKIYSTSTAATGIMGWY